MADSTLDALHYSTPGTAGLLYTVQGGADRKLSMTAAGASMIEAANAAAQQVLLGITGGGAISLGGFTLTVPANGTAALLATANPFTTLQTVSVGTNSPTPASGFSLTNSTAATAGTQSASPLNIRTGQGWKTNATAGSQSVVFQDFVLPVQGAANPTALWKMQKSINAETAADILTLLATAGTTDAALTVGGGAGALLISTQSGYYTSISQPSGGVRFVLGGSSSFYIESNRITVGSSIPISFSSTTVANGTADSGLGRSAAGVVEVNSGTLGTLRDILTRNTITTPVTVAALAGATKGARAFVTDATLGLTAGIGTTVVGGGANNVPVVYDGTNWLIG